MKKTLYVVGLLAFLSCSDGDLQIENINFDDSAVQTCETTTIATNLFYKIDQDEALILDLQSDLLANETSSEPISGSIPTSSTLTYRVFSANVSLSSYFCADIPPVEPNVLEEILAESGDIGIETNVDTVTVTTKTYVHLITITNLNLINSIGERITDEPGLEFGEVQTTVNSSVQSSFSNFSEVSIAGCTGQDGAIRLSKTLNDEQLMLQLNQALIANSPTGGTPRTAALSDVIYFENTVAQSILSDTNTTCDAVDGSIVENRFSANDGGVSISTIENAPDADGIVTFDHTITLTALNFTDLNGTAVGATLESYVFGTYRTTQN